mmetsp:Transcript_5388/g.13030  ORF Transcript_5388/g.13030 Transcript_5388/m.13030 type:complete len:405 (-) Transcript_5388:70-1284(-)
MYWRAPRQLEWLLALLSVGAVAGNFASSLHSNFVINLDFESAGQQQSGQWDSALAQEVRDDDTKLMAFAGGQQKFRCHLPSSNAQSSLASGDQADLKKLKAQFKQAKMAALKGRCSMTGAGDWSYELCFGDKLSQFRSDSDGQYEVGFHDPQYDELYGNGTVSEWYLGGVDNRSAEVRYVCGASSPASSGRFTVEQVTPLSYLITVAAPVFCSWREKEGAETKDESGEVMKVSSVLEGLRGSCVNVTHQWWTYEYCYPDTMRQFHLSSNGRIRDPEHVLGTLNGTDAIAEPHKVDMTIVKQKKSSLSDRRSLSSPRQLHQRLGGGAICHETGKERATNVYFQCPADWKTAQAAKIVSITEGTLCEYDIMVHTTLLCGHHGFMPALPKGREAIRCVAEPEPQSEL